MKKPFKCYGPVELDGEQFVKYRNDKYQVLVRQVEGGEIPVVHLSIKRIDQQAIHDWRDLQSIKNELVGYECEGIEIYPADSRMVDMANQYHLWVFADPKFKISLGFHQGKITKTPDEASRVGAVQRPFRLL